MKYIANILQMNISTLDRNDEKDKTIIEKQEGYINKLLDMAAKLEKDSATAETKANNEEKQEDEEIKKDIEDESEADDIVGKPNPLSEILEKTKT